MAFFNPLGAIAAGASGAVRGYTEDLPKLYDLMGMQALGKAFQPQQGPIDQMNARGPQPPMPGEPSMAQGPMPNGAPPLGAPPPQMQQPAMAVPPEPGPQQMPPGAPPPVGAMPPPGGPSPGGGPMPGPGAGAAPSQQPNGMPQFDLQTLAQRIQQANPGLPPQAMVAALTRAVPLLNTQGRMELAKIRQDMQAEMLDYRYRALDTRENIAGRTADIQERKLAQAGQPPAVGGMLSPDAVNNAAERYLKTGTMPPNLGRGVQGRADMAAIQNRAAELAKERNIPADDLLKKQQQFKAEQIAIQRFMSGPQGNTIRSLNVVVDHLATMRDLTTALQNKDIQAFNRISQAFAEQTGNSAPTNFDTAKQIVGAEIIKALGVAGAGTQAERREAADAFSRARSPEQLMGAIKVAQKLLSGQLRGMRQQFVKATGLKQQDFDEMMLPEAKGFLNQAPTESANTVVKTRGGWSFERLPDAGGQ